MAMFVYQRVTILTMAWPDLVDALARRFISACLRSKQLTRVSARKQLGQSRV